MQGPLFRAIWPNEDAVPRVFFGLWVREQMKLHRISGYRDIRGKEKAAYKKEFHDFGGKMRYSLFDRIGAKPNELPAAGQMFTNLEGVAHCAMSWTPIALVLRETDVRKAFPWTMV